MPSLQVVGMNAALKAFEGTTIGAAVLSRCIDLNEDAATYIVVPHFATEAGPTSSVSYELQAGAGGAQASVRPAASVNGAMVQEARPITLQQRFDAALRAAEQQLAPSAAEERSRSGVSASVAPSPAVAPPALGSTRQFKVLNTLNPDPTKATFDNVTAALRFAGNNILIYVDQAAPAEPKGFSDAQLTAFGKLFDQDLYKVDVDAFGQPSDIDQNGRVIVLLTPTVNKLTPSTSCSKSYVAGFFYPLDLLTAQANSNKAEIFYTLVPDPDATFGCAHSVDQIEASTPATFVHEFQHMISWNQHVTVRKGISEDLWLNEALSHIAEELASRHYEDKFPAPQGRTDPRQIFPDSAAPFINGVLFDSYSFLLDPTRWSITKFIEGGNLEERGGAWLFLRWLGDQKGSDVYKRLVQTNLTGIANVEAQAGEKFPQLFGDFTLALYTDSLPGVPRSSVPPRYRFASRNLRMLYNALYNAVSDRKAVPRRFPLELKDIAAPGAKSGTMVPGTADFVRLQMPTGSGSQTLRFSKPGGGSFDGMLGAQATVFRCPSAAACPATIAP
jgi:hypothetical protein